MIGSLTKALKKVFGDKAQRDLKDIQPLVEQVNVEFAKLASLSNDELRGRTTSFKERIRAKVKDEEDRIATLRQEIEDRSEDAHPRSRAALRGDRHAWRRPP